ncbi:MAG: alpha/beta hydrolase [Sphingomonadales bacterium]|jgi:pimeloyl-ACP methyl ester carboxylesterase
MRFKAIAVALALVISGCGNSEVNIKRTTSVATSFDGNLITYETRGQGDIALVFIHCWACNRDFWKEQLPYFETDYKVIAIDLPGHGTSGTNRAHWSIDNFGLDVKAVLDAQKVKNAILIGHSMGGPVALAAAKHLQGRVKAIACVDTLHNLEQMTPAKTMEPFIAAMKADYAGMMTNMANAMFPKNSDPNVKAYVLKQALAAHKESIIAIMKGFIDLDLGQLAAEANVPIRCINAAPLPPAIPETTIKANRRYADFDAVLMENVGHYLYLEQPEAFNTQLSAVIEQFK